MQRGSSPRNLSGASADLLILIPDGRVLPAIERTGAQVGSRHHGQSRIELTPLRTPPDSSTASLQFAMGQGSSSHRNDSQRRENRRFSHFIPGRSRSMMDLTNSGLDPRNASEAEGLSGLPSDAQRIGPIPPQERYVRHQEPQSTIRESSIRSTQSTFQQRTERGIAAMRRRSAFFSGRVQSDGPGSRGGNSESIVPNPPLSSSPNIGNMLRSDTTPHEPFTIPDADHRSANPTSQNDLNRTRRHHLTESRGGDLEMPDAPESTTSDMPSLSRHASVLSRVGARLIPRYISSDSPEMAGSESENQRFVRRRLADRLSLNRDSSDPFRAPPSTYRPSPLPLTGTTSPTSRRRRNILSISRPIPLAPEPWQSHEESFITSTPSPSISAAANPMEPQTAARGPSLHYDPFSGPRSRLTRVRDSFSTPIQNIVNNHSRGDDTRSRSPLRSSRASYLGDGGYQDLRSVPNTHDRDFGIPRSNPPPISRRPPRSPPRDRTRSPSRDRNRLPHTINGARLQPGEDQAAMLSRLLSHAAALTASTLVGNGQQAFSESQDVGGDEIDGSFDSFLRALRNGRLAAALRNGGSEMGGGSAANAGETIAPLNFFRMFRFGNSGTNTPAAAETSQTQTAPASVQIIQDENQDPLGRMVPVIIVGIRSVTPRDSINRDDDAMLPGFLDNMGAMPTTPPAGVARRDSGRLRRQSESRSRFGLPRRASVATTNPFPANYDSQRHQRLSNSIRPSSEILSSIPNVLSDSPPGPHPPPSTPADPGLSAHPSGSSTPTRRPSSASAAGFHAAASSRLQSENAPWGSAMAQNYPSSGDDGPSHRNARSRRLSGSEFGRRRDSGYSNRRNGIVGENHDSPSDGHPTEASGSATSDGTRSWIIYVLGGSYPENHPILTTPSLFTDSPTYEDMLLLSSILGPAKPPVASEDDVASAPGVLRVVQVDPRLIVSRSNNENIEIPAGDRCLVCLGDYELLEELRELSRCNHIFHRACIDEWLTTGRNSCPLCRGEGVQEKSQPSQGPPQEPETPIS
ncbi:MAG: hypothetical protein M1829_002354 [Trizodia sp. TS-e1964]|nr:MAG: hypothetical protein M1829_002354 [Trizodia sp. TS-e1964]